MPGILDGLENVRRKIEDRVGLDSREKSVGPAKYIEDMDSAALRLFKKDRAFNGEQPLIRESSMLHRFSDPYEFPAVLSDLHFPIVQSGA